VDFGCSAHQESSSSLQPRFIQHSLVPLFLLQPLAFSSFTFAPHCMSLRMNNASLPYITVSSPHSLNCSEMINSHWQSRKFCSLGFMHMIGTAKAHPMIIQVLFIYNEDLVTSFYFTKLFYYSLRRYDLWFCILNLMPLLLAQFSMSSQLFLYNIPIFFYI